MRLKLTWVSIFVLILLVTSCHDGINSDEEVFQEINEKSSRLRRAQSFYPTPNRKTSNQLIVKFRSTANEVEKANVRSEYKVQTFSRCNCNENGIELWQFDPDSVGKGGIEEIKTIVNTDPDLESSDFQFQFSIASLPSTVGIYNDFTSKVKTINNGVTIAVIDSGIDPSIPNISGRFLYNSGSDRNCNMTSPSGWDFVENDSIPQDEQGHGSIVSAIIAEKLTASNINFQILPVKAFGSDGSGSLFNIACALQYAINNTDVDLINMSFGWYYDSSEIIEGLLDAAAGSKVLIASAGNTTNNNDFIPHYPSGYLTSNLITIGAHGILPTEMAPYSNYGFSSVDLAAPGSFSLFNLESMAIGTSFSAAFVSAKCAEIIDANPPITGSILPYLLLESTYRLELNGLGKLKYPYTVNP